MSTSPFAYPRVGVAVFIQHPKTELHPDPVFLFGLRQGSHGSGTWGLPGGHLEYGESFEECAEREVLEETGFKTTGLRFLTSTNDIFEDKDGGRHYITIFMIGVIVLDDCTLQNGQTKELQAILKEPEKCKAWKWFSWEDITAWAKQQPAGDNIALQNRPFLPLINLTKQRPEIHPAYA